LAQTLYDLIVNVNEEGFKGMTSTVEDSLEFIKNRDQFESQDLYELIKEDIPEAPELYEDAVDGILDEVIDKVTGTEGSIELTYKEGRVMGLYSVLDFLHEMNHNPMLMIKFGGFAEGLKRKLDSIYHDREDALVN